MAIGSGHEHFFSIPGSTSFRRLLFWWAFFWLGKAVVIFFSCPTSLPSRKSPMNCNLWWSVMGVVSHANGLAWCGGCPVLPNFDGFCEELRVSPKPRKGFASLIGYSNRETPGAKPKLITFSRVVLVLDKGSPIYDICIVGSFPSKTPTTKQKHFPASP